MDYPFGGVGHNFLDTMMGISVFIAAFTYGEKH
jgi:hypothetical protein